MILTFNSIISEKSVKLEKHDIGDIIKRVHEHK